MVARHATHTRLLGGLLGVMVTTSDNQCRSIPRTRSTADYKRRLAQRMVKEAVDRCLLEGHAAHALEGESLIVVCDVGLSSNMADARKMSALTSKAKSSLDVLRGADFDVRTLTCTR